MQRRLDTFPFILALFTVSLCTAILLFSLLLFSYIADISDSGNPPHQITTVNPERAPHIDNDTQLLRSSTLRVPQQKAQTHTKATLPWPVMISAMTLFTAGYRFTHHTPRSYLSFENNRLAGWQDTNLQFRFIHSR
ncbi:hypothetical protein [Vibrio methylphosphonaticus]|uniref:hypothetical protein n=1 Tax=Vibrio methylphosphonaticus TaxID=2946866 RepID=UPI00202A7C04|nr:hypothetical protein [Vibrio methylphosphonaticus]MCL9777419.1 hypothetical protein [Vibrio methylphosphonaticus]